MTDLNMLFNQVRVLDRLLVKYAHHIPDFEEYARVSAAKIIHRISLRNAGFFDDKVDDRPWGADKWDASVQEYDKNTPREYAECYCYDQEENG